MQAVLGIDAAWTTSEPSGVALVIGTKGSWRLIAVEPSYQHFNERAHSNSSYCERPRGSVPDAEVLIASASLLSSAAICIVAIDMPLSHKPISGRRVSDNAVSKAYGGRKSSTHTPSVSRPGVMSDQLRSGFAEVGYPLLTEFNSKGLIEVYPHPALIELARESERLPYKASKLRKYWPEKSLAERRELLYEQWAKIVTLLDEDITGVADAMLALPSNAAVVDRKAFEDKLDAIVCAWVAICFLENRAMPFGDDDSAIWIPTARILSDA